MTEKLYEVDSYVQNFTAQVVSCTPVPGGFAVVLDRTAFFPEGGGQPCDTGRLGGARVLAVSSPMSGMQPDVPKNTSFNRYTVLLIKVNHFCANFVIMITDKFIIA